MDEYDPSHLDLEKEKGIHLFKGVHLHICAFCDLEATDVKYLDNL